MNTKQFDEIVNNRCEKIKEVLTSKAKEYAGTNDERLHNFKVAARVLNSTPEKALLGMLMKHTVSVLDLIENIDKGITPSEYLINEKIGDSINYHILLEALMIERLSTITKV